MSAKKKTLVDFLNYVKTNVIIALAHCLFLSLSRARARSLLPRLIDVDYLIDSSFSFVRMFCHVCLIELRATEEENHSKPVSNAKVVISFLFCISFPGHAS